MTGVGGMLRGSLGGLGRVLYRLLWAEETSLGLWWYVEASGLSKANLKRIGSGEDKKK